MLQSTFILSLLTGLSLSAVLPVDLLLPSFAIVMPGATIDPISTPASVPKPTSTSAPVDDDQPDPYNSMIKVPASLSFNPSKAPAFTLLPGVPNPSVYPSTPCSSEATATPMPNIPSMALPIATPSSKAPSNGQVTPILPSSAALPIQTPAPDNSDDDEPCDEDDESSAPAPIVSQTPRPPIPAGSHPTFPLGAPVFSGIARPSDRPAFGWGRPRPTGAFPSRGAARPTHGFGHPKKPSAAAATSTPCTLETRIRPTPTA